MANFFRWDLTISRTGSGYEVKYGRHLNAVKLKPNGDIDSMGVVDRGHIYDYSQLSDPQARNFVALCQDLIREGKYVFNEFYCLAQRDNDTQEEVLSVAIRTTKVNYLHLEERAKTRGQLRAQPLLYKVVDLVGDR